MFHSKADADSSAYLCIAKILLAASMLWIGSVPVQAQARAQEITSIGVRYSDLDLSTQADAARLYQRLELAARRACDSKADLRNLRLQRLQQRCYEDSLQQAVARVGHASIHALYAARIQAASERG